MYFLGALECAGHSFAYVAHFVFLRDVCIRTQRATVASRRATNFAIHLPFMFIIYIFSCLCRRDSLRTCHTVDLKNKIVLNAVHILVSDYLKFK
jgi:hypothetical protein